MIKLRWNTWTLQILLLAIVYFITGRLGLLWAMPPGYASPIWPPTGIGVAALLLMGLNRWPGIFLGAFAISYTVAPPDVAPWIALCTASGNSLSLFLGAYLIKKVLSYPKPFYRILEITLFLLIAGPFCAAVSSTLSAIYLLFFQQIHTGNLFINWLYWFVGDAIGGVIFAPIALIFSVESRKLWYRSFTNVLIPLMLFFALITGIVHYLSKSEKTKAQLRFNRKAELVEQLLNKEFSSYQANLATMLNFFQNSVDVSQSEFSSFAKHLLTSHSEVQSLARFRLIDGQLKSFNSLSPDDENLLGSENFVSTVKKSLLDNSIEVLGPLQNEKTKKSLLVLIQSYKQDAIVELIQLDGLTHLLSTGLNDQSFRLMVRRVTDLESNVIKPIIALHPQQTSLQTTDYFHPDFSWSKHLIIGGTPWIASLEQDTFLRNGFLASTSTMLGITFAFAYVSSTFLLSIANNFLMTNYLVDEKTTHLKEANAQLQKASKTKSEFLANMSHEIRTPLSVLLGMTDLLAESSLSPDQHHYIEIAQKAGQNLLNIVNDILDISKIESGQISLESTEINLREVVKEVQDLFQMKAQEKGLTLNAFIASEIKPQYLGDSVRIKQILSNLVSNALKFTQSGHIDIRVQPNTHATRPGNILFQVQDTGIGIDPEKINYLFKPFAQADASITRKFGGTGLGLYICKRLVQMMNGSIEVFSELGHGSTFSFTLELQAATVSPFAKSTEVERPLPAPPLSDRPLHVLIVDDTEDNRALVRAFLKDTSHHIIEARNGLEAIEIIKRENFDLVLMDMQMPEMDGVSATQEIRKWEKEFNRPPVTIWALTAYALKGEIEKSLQAGCNMHLVKPIKKFELLNHIRKLATPS